MKIIPQFQANHKPNLFMGNVQLQKMNCFAQKISRFVTCKSITLREG